jgi:hypothetical protein
MRSLAALLWLWSFSALAGDQQSILQRQQALVSGATAAAARLAEDEYWDGLDFMPTRQLKVAVMHGYVSLGEGWYRASGWGVWSRGHHSSLFLRAAPGAAARRLLLHGRYANGPEATRVSVNGVLLSEAPLQELTIELPAELAAVERLRIDIEHLNPVAPRDFDPSSDDPRLLKFALVHIRLY